MKVLTVCLGNICRSPAAQGILEHLGKSQKLDLQVSSAGTAAYHIGKQPDSRSIKVLASEGIDITHQRARQISERDFYDYDWILAMDAENLANLKRLQPAGSHAHVVLFGQYRTGVNFGEVADPYYGGDEGFDLMKNQLLDMSKDFLANAYE